MLVGCVTPLAGQALPPAADGIAFLRLTGINYFIFAEATKRTQHGIGSIAARLTPDAILNSPQRYLHTMEY